MSSSKIIMLFVVLMATSYVSAGKGFKNPFRSSKKSKEAPLLPTEADIIFDSNFPKDMFIQKHANCIPFILDLKSIMLELGNKYVPNEEESENEKDDKQAQQRITYGEAHNLVNEIKNRVPQYCLSLFLNSRDIKILGKENFSEEYLGLESIMQNLEIFIRNYREFESKISSVKDAYFLPHGVSGRDNGYFRVMVNSFYELIKLYENYL